MPYYSNPRACWMRETSYVLAAPFDAAADARRAVRALPVGTATSETLELLVSELVANAVLHAGGDLVSLQITAHPDRVRLAVQDGGPGFAAPPVDRADPLTAGGRGCRIVDVLSDAWGIESDEGGCTMWCELGMDEERVRARQGRLKHTV